MSAPFESAIGHQGPAESSAAPLRINAFPTGKDIWRIDWFGPIAFPDRMTRRRHPSVLVYLSKVVAPSPLENPASLLQPSCSLPASQQTKRWVSVGTTLLLRIGDLWQNQTLVARPAYEEATFTDITIDRDHTSLIKAGLSFDDGKFLLPLSHHPWHLNNTHSYCIRVALPDDKFLVVPCMELVRFYFGSSSELISRLFAPPLARSSLHGKSYIAPSGRMSLELAERIPRASAEDIARIAGSDTAWRAAALVPASCLKASTAGRDIYPQAIFPFEGNTTLKVIGKWLPQGDVEQGTFLAYQLLSCSHPFPFQSLHFRQSRSVTQGVNKGNANSSAANKSQPQRATTQPKTAVLQEHDASSTLAATVRAITGRRRFTDLDQKFIQAEPPAQKPSPPITPAGSSPAVTDMAIGSPGSSRRIRPVSLVDAKANAQTDIPDFLRGIVSAMESIEGLQVRILQTQAKHSWTIASALLADEDGVIREQLLVHGKKKKPRRIASFIVAKEDAHAIVTAVEGEAVMLLLSSLSPAEAAEPTAACLHIAALADSTFRAGVLMTYVSLTMPNGAEYARHWLAERLAYQAARRR